MGHDDPPGALPIGDVARRTGIAVPTLRAWQERYGVLRPIRTAGGHRRYSEADVRRVLAVRDLVADGWTVKAAAGQVIGQVIREADQPEHGEIERLRERLVRAVDEALHDVTAEVLQGRPGTRAGPDSPPRAAAPAGPAGAPGRPPSGGRGHRSPPRPGSSTRRSSRPSTRRPGRCSTSGTPRRRSTSSPPSRPTWAPASSRPTWPTTRPCRSTSPSAKASPSSRPPTR